MLLNVFTALSILLPILIVMLDRVVSPLEGGVLIDGSGGLLIQSTWCRVSAAVLTHRGSLRAGDSNCRKWMNLIEDGAPWP